MAEEEKEIWKEIPDYPYYKVSTFGRVMSNKRYRNGKILKPQPTSDDYLRVGLSKNKKQKLFSVHRLLALTFLPNYYNLPQVDHKDRNKHNNSIYNLRWVTQEENMCNRDDYRTDIEELDPKKRNKITTKQSRQKIIDSKKYYCNTCNYAFDSNSALERHINGPRCKKKHLDNLTREPI